MIRRFLPFASTSMSRRMSLARRVTFGLSLLALIPLLTFAQTVTMNFKDADIRAVIGTVAEITGKNFIIDPRVNGRVTIISSRPMSKDEVYQIFLSVLEVNGFATVPAGNVIKIIPDANAKFGNIPTIDGSEATPGDQIVTQIIELDNVQAAQLVPILRPLASPQAHMAAFPGSNILVISDRAANATRLADIIKRIDKPNTSEIEIIRLEHASAAELVRILTTLDQQSKQGDPTAVRTTLIADERTNSILVSGDQADRLRIRATISHLDTAVESDGGNTHVVYLRYAKAEDLASVLSGVPVTGGGVDDGERSVTDGEGSPGAIPPPIAPGSINPQELLARARSGGFPIGGGGGGAGAAEEDEISIVADEATNSLVITAPPDRYRGLLAVIRQLDVRRAQVVVEAVIAEVSVDKAKELGIQLRFAPDDFDGAGIFTGSNFGTGPGINQVSANPASVGDGFTLGIFDGFATIPGPNGTSLRILNLGVLVRALATDADTNVLSTPTLVTMDNEEAEIVVGQNVPFVTGSFSSIGDGGGGTAGNPFQTIQREDVGLKLKIKPQINEGDAITLEIEQEVSSIAPGTTAAADLITNKRSIKTSVTIDDGKFLVLGGLITDNLTESVQKVPILGDIPGLGALFRNKRTTIGKTNLMVFLHPVILRDGEGGARISSSKYNYIRAEQLRKAQDGVSLYPDATAPILPPIEEFLSLPPPFAGDGGSAPTAPAPETDLQSRREDTTAATGDVDNDPGSIPGWNHGAAPAAEDAPIAGWSDRGDTGSNSVTTARDEPANYAEDNDIPWWNNTHNR